MSPDLAYFKRWINKSLETWLLYSTVSPITDPCFSILLRSICIVDGNFNALSYI